MTKKYLLVTDKCPPELHLLGNKKVEIFQVEQTFLKSSVGESILHKVGKNDSYTCSHEMRYNIKGENIQKKRQITAREYVQMLGSCDESKRQVKKIKQCFIYENYYYIVESFTNIEPYPSILRVDSTTLSSKKKLPPFLSILREVTNESNYETWFMANKQYVMPEEDHQKIKAELELKTVQQ